MGHIRELFDFFRTFYAVEFEDMNRIWEKKKPTANSYCWRLKGVTNFRLDIHNSLLIIECTLVQ